jgi:SLOG in TRPM, prokaryote
VKAAAPELDTFRLRREDSPMVHAVDLGHELEARAVRVAELRDLESAARALGLEQRPCLATVGGASRMSAEEVEVVRGAFEDVLAPTAERLQAVVVDGGTDAGVMRLMGQAREAASGTFRLVGVVVDALAAYGSGNADPDAGELEPHHTDFVFVPGSRWGDESRWIAGLASAIAGSAQSATVVANGGRVAWMDVRHSIEARRPVIALAGSGRTADALAAAARGEESDRRARELVDSGLVRAIDVHDRNELSQVLYDLLGERS